MPNIKIATYTEPYRNKIIDLILEIQLNEFQFKTTIKESPGLESISFTYQNAGGNFWMALDDDQVVGVIGLQKISDQKGCVKRMYVDKRYRGKDYGVAQSLMETLISFCEQNGIHDVYLGTRAQYLAAHRFYEKNKFQEILKEELPTTFPIMSVDTKFYLRTI